MTENYYDEVFGSEPKEPEKKDENKSPSQSDRDKRIEELQAQLLKEKLDKIMDSCTTEQLVQQVFSGIGLIYNDSIDGSAMMKEILRRLESGTDRYFNIIKTLRNDEEMKQKQMELIASGLSRCRKKVTDTRDNLMDMSQSLLKFQRALKKT